MTLLFPSDLEGGSAALDSRTHASIAARPLKRWVSTATPVFLTDATWYGTLAAARDLGSRGVPVILGHHGATAVTRWSRFVSATVPCPPARDPDAFLEWLLDFGAAHPGCVLYPTSDDVAFVIALHREVLQEYFQLFSPSVDALIAVLDKGQLAGAAGRAGLKAAPTWEPVDEDELHRLIPDLPFPLLVKPRAQILSAKGSKGVRVDRPEDLVAAWREVRAAASVHRAAIAACPTLDRPVIQPYLQLSEGIYTVDGFMDAEGKLVGALACVKGLQLPRRSGSGILFEHAELAGELAAGMERMLAEIGHVGVFDAEFAVHGDEKLLIDLNPRFYNHMAYETDRGLPLPWLAYLSATRQRDAIPAALAEAKLAAPCDPGVYLHRLPMRVMLAAQALSGGMSRAERTQWRRTIARKGVLTDAVCVPGDSRPRYADLLQLFRHPRSLLKKAAH